MSGESIALAKHFDIDKLTFPVMLSKKLDGVPVRFIITDCGQSIRCVSRQWEHLESCLLYAQSFVSANMGRFKPDMEYNFVWEVTHETLKGFKDISGVVRRKSHQPQLVFNLFDFEFSGKMPYPFSTRIDLAESFNFLRHDVFKVIQQHVYHDAETLQDALDNTPLGADEEGWCIRDCNAVWKPATRHWDYQKIVKEPTIDLWIVGAEEGKGKFAGGVGRFIARYKGNDIGIGPGKQTTAERSEALDYFKRCMPVKRMAKIKYKPDEGYAALRQPTFQCWRDDKTEADA